MKLIFTGASCVLGALLLTACASDGEQVRSDPIAPSTLERALADAARAQAAGHTDKAQGILRGAATTYPAEKAPWLHLAQMKFDRASYGEAIINAQEALQRDPADKLGNSIVAVSGLRLSTKALADLGQHNNLNGSLRSEAQDLARLLRNSLGEDVLVPSAGVRKPGPPPVKKAGTLATTAGPSAAPASAAPPAKNSGQSSGSDPFGALK
ncbi:hypothetical protein HSX11_23345 [Oxalobacteraceae bacterium]|nr:hypothetical protein [Oxalobacteraceae bacterium]